MLEEVIGDDCTSVSVTSSDSSSFDEGAEADHDGATALGTEARIREVPHASHPTGATALPGEGGGDIVDRLWAEAVEATRDVRDNVA
jgi:hypothetical protein